MKNIQDYIMELQFSSTINSPVIDVFSFYNDLNNQIKISPPFLHLEVLDILGNMRTGTQLLFNIKYLFSSKQWKLSIIDHRPNRFYVVQQIEGPFSTYWHKTEFNAGQNGTELVDFIRFELPYQPVSIPFEKWLVIPRVKKILKYRHNKTRQYLENRKPLK